MNASPATVGTLVLAGSSPYQIKECSMTLTEKVIARIPCGRDLEVHVKVTQAGAQSVVSVREYVPSRDFYGRGLPLSPEILGDLAEALDEAAVHLGVN